MLTRLRLALTALTEQVYHYSAEPNVSSPYIVWAEDGGIDFESDNTHSERGFSGTIDLFTETEDDPLMESVAEALEEIEASYYLSSVQFEDETGLIHYEWVFEVV